MPKGSVGTPTVLVYIKDKRKKFKHGKGYKFCVRCRKAVKKCEWISLTGNLLYRHTYLCYPDSHDATQE